MRHVIPVNDICTHDESIDCVCGPIVREDGVVIHHSLDGRERWEELDEGNS